MNPHINLRDYSLAALITADTEWIVTATEKPRGAIQEKGSIISTEEGVVFATLEPLVQLFYTANGYTVKIEEGGENLFVAEVKNDEETLRICFERVSLNAALYEITTLRTGSA